jgi:predicted nucleic acid-binding protein
VVNLYLDTSSLLKLYLLEIGTPETQALRDRADSVATSLVAYPEARSGLARALRSGRITSADYQTVLLAFEADWPMYLVQDVTNSLVRLAGDLTEKHLLRGYDAVHLASAVTLQRELSEPVTFSAWDERLMAAAAAEGLTPAH